MIAAYFKDRKYYDSLIPQLKEIQKIVKESGTMSCGRYETDWGFYLIQEGNTYPAGDGVFESHKRYLDVQCLAEGREWLEWQDIDRLELKEAYSDEKDVQFMLGNGNFTEIYPDMFYVMFPEDGHKACCHKTESVRYRKVVAKIRL